VAVELENCSSTGYWWTGRVGMGIGIAKGVVCFISLFSGFFICICAPQLLFYFIFILIVIVIVRLIFI